MHDVNVHDVNVLDVNVLDVLIPEVGAIYVMDRGYLDFGRLFSLSQTPAFFIIRAKANTKLRRLYSQPVEKASGLRCGQTVVLDGHNSRRAYPDKLLRIRYFVVSKIGNWCF